MQESFSCYLSLVSEGEPPSAYLDVSFDVSVRDGGKSRVVQSYSRGWRDLLQFCARLSLIKALFAEGELPFLILDDPFVNLDQTHLAKARELLDRLSSEFQIVYLVCHEGRS